MARQELANRNKWQGKAGETGAAAELLFEMVLKTHFENTDYEVIRHPSIFTDVYNKGIKSKKSNRMIKKHGFRIDFQIRNKVTDKSVFVEMKRQKAGRGNAHERACKFFMPWMQEVGRHKGNLTHDINPFWIVFSNGITTDKKRAEEITHWFKGIEDCLLLWSDIRDKNPVINHFEKNIREKLK